MLWNPTICIALLLVIITIEMLSGWHLKLILCAEGCRLGIAFCSYAVSVFIFCRTEAVTAYIAFDKVCLQPSYYSKQFWFYFGFSQMELA